MCFEKGNGLMNSFYSGSWLVAVQMRLLLRWGNWSTEKLWLAKCYTVVPALPSALSGFHQRADSCCLPLFYHAFENPKVMEQCPPESRCTLLILLDAFKEITDVCCFHLHIFVAHQYDEKERSAGIPRGRRGCKASPKWWLNLQINLCIYRSFKPVVSGGCISIGNWITNCVLPSSGSSKRFLPAWCVVSVEICK